MDVTQHFVRALIAVFLLGDLFSASLSLSAPQVQATDLAGNTVNPFQLSKQKVVVFIFVRTDCPIANRYAPTIEQLSKIYAQKAAFWLVYPDRKESAEAIRKHDEEFGYKIPVLRDSQLSLVRLSHAQITPEVAVFDSNRQLLYHGRIDNLYEDFAHSRKAATTHEMKDAIEAAIQGKPLPQASTPAVGCYISDLE